MPRKTKKEETIVMEENAILENAPAETGNVLESGSPAESGAPMDGETLTGGESSVEEELLNPDEAAMDGELPGSGEAAMDDGLPDPGEAFMDDELPDSGEAAMDGELPGSGEASITKELSGSYEAEAKEVLPNSGEDAESDDSASGNVLMDGNQPDKAHLFMEETEIGNVGGVELQPEDAGMPLLRPEKMRQPTQTDLSRKFLLRTGITMKAAREKIPLKPQPLPENGKQRLHLQQNRSPRQGKPPLPPSFP